MAGSTITISANNIQQVLNELDTKKETVLKAVGMAAATYAKGNLEHDPRRINTGNLRNRTESRVEGDSAYIGTNVDYGIYVELGTLKMTPSHFLKRAVADHIDEYRNIIIAQLEE